MIIGALERGKFDPPCPGAPGGETVAALGDVTGIKRVQAKITIEIPCLWIDGPGRLKACFANKLKMKAKKYKSQKPDMFNFFPSHRCV